MFLGVFCVITGYAFDTIKVRQQNFSTSLLIAVRETYKYEGILGFYRGMASPLIAYGPSNSLFFGVYGICLKFLQGNSYDTSKNIEKYRGRFFWDLFCAGTYNCILARTYKTKIASFF